MKGFNLSCMGESHKATRKPCQDFSIFYSDKESGTVIAIICDGHGGDRYFRSDTGSRILAEITRDTILEFVKGTPEGTFTTSGLVQSGPGEHPDGYGIQDEVLGRLFSSIVYRWQEEIERDAQMNPLSPEEMQHVKPEYVKAFTEGQDLEKAYGSTLIAYFQTGSYWVSFHIGDGRCIMFTEDGCIFEPVPWDKRCFLNSTTSICDQDALDEFRYAWQSGDSKPFAVFLGSDGISDSFGNGKLLHAFYLNILRSIIEDGEEATKLALAEALPDISEKGSRDDMSVSLVYDESTVLEKTCMFTTKQLSANRDELEATVQEIDALEKKRDLLSAAYSELKDKNEKQEKNDSPDLQSEKTRIELKYAIKDLDKARIAESDISSRIEALEDFLHKYQDNDTIEESEESSDT